MTNNEMIRLSLTLSQNPNAGKLSNKWKTDFFAFKRKLTNHIDDYANSQEATRKEHGIVADNNGDHKVSADKLRAENPTAYDKFIAEWKGLGKIDATLEEFRLPADEFWVFVSDKRIAMGANAEGVPIFRDFCYTVDDIEFLEKFFKA